MRAHLSGPRGSEKTPPLHRLRRWWLRRQASGFVRPPWDLAGPQVRLLPREGKSRRQQAVYSANDWELQLSTTANPFHRLGWSLAASLAIFSSLLLGKEGERPVPQGNYEAGSATNRAVLPHTGRWAMAGVAPAVHPFQTPATTKSFAGLAVTHTNSAAGGATAGHMNVSHFHTNVATHTNVLGTHANAYNVHINVVGLDTLRQDSLASDASDSMAAGSVTEPQ